MNKRFKELTVKLADTLENHTYKFMVENLKSEENTSDIINLVLSSHLSSMFTVMKRAAEDLDKKEHLKQVHEFILQMTEAIRKMNPIEKIEIIDQ